jgi:hypothetical protein
MEKTMSTQITWNISQLDCKPQEDGHTDVVVTAHWQCTGTDPNGKQNIDQNGNVVNLPVTSQIYGTASFTYTPSGPFTPYVDLTQDQVLGWCWANGVDKDATEAKVEAQLEAQINPPIIAPPLPWAQQGESNV